MEVTYRRDSEHNYMILKVSEDVQGNEYQIRMLLVNEISGLLRCRLRNIDGVSYLYYEITSKQTLARIFEHRPVGNDDIRALIPAIGRTMEGIARYLLPDDGLLLEPEFIYMDVESKEVSFCYLPFGQRNIAESFRELAEYLLKNLNHEDEQAVLLGYQLYSGTVEENYSVSAVIQSLHGKLGKVRKKETESRNASEGKQEKETKKENKAEKKPKEIYKPEVKEKKPERSMVTGQERLKKKKKQKKLAGIVFLALLCIVGISALTVFRILTLTQAGGILFLAAGVFYYLCMGRREKQKEAKEEQGEIEGKGQGRRKKIFWWNRGRMFGEGQDRERENRRGHSWEKRDREELQRKKRDKKDWEEQGQKKQEDYEKPAAVHDDELPEEEICEFLEDSGEEVYGQTTFLGESITGEYPVLISNNPGVRGNVVIDKEKFIIGKLKGQVDMVLDLPVISRMHAGIERRDESYFLVDLNSMNGTYLNGERLEANEYRQIHTGDEIIFAGAGYYFKA